MEWPDRAARVSTPGGAASAPVGEAVSSGGKIDINTASASALEALPGIGPSKASAIVADREANGPYSSCSDLTRVKGIGSATVSNIGSACTISAATP